MIDTTADHLESRILVLAPTGKDSALAQTVFERAGVASRGCGNLSELCQELEAGAGAVLLAEEAVVQGSQDELTAWLKRQPAWSDLPILVLARSGADSAAVARAMNLLGNVTVLERPTRVAALVSTTRAALRARQKQYQIREHLAERELTESVLRANDQRKDEFLAILAHELRNPLAAIRNSLHILHLNRSVDPALSQVSSMMERQVNHLVRLVDDLLEISRITRGKIELRMEPVELAQIVRNAVEASRPLIDSAGHQLAITLPSSPVTVEADPVRLTQILANLLNNAAKYTPQPGHIWLTARQEEGQATISVRDTGAGIASHMLRRVFDLFTQVDERGERTHGGLGIGLTLVKSLVELHGGTVVAVSEGLGQGSEFTLRLPINTASSLNDKPGPEIRTAALTQRRILVVDDNRDAADSMGVLLELLGAEVEVAYSGAAALEKLRSYQPSAILLDIGMPGMDGHEVARQIRSRPELQGVMLIALTGWGQEEDVRRTQAAGFNHHLTKPADVDALQSLLLSLDASLN